MRTFAVSAVKPGGKALPGVELSASLSARMKSRLEACGSASGHLVECETHPLVEGAVQAFARHHPLVLSPDDIWLCLAQGFGAHVNLHAEALRARFVAHEGKEELKVHRDHFIQGSPDNDWQGVFGELTELIAKHLGKKRDLIVADFTTTGPVERAASQVVLLSAMRAYFDVTVMSMSGIPSITLLGTPGDWEQVRARARVLGEFGLEWWLATLEPVLDQFVAAAGGDVDTGFWRSFVKYNDESGGPYVSGWMNALFPYLEPAGRARVSRSDGPRPLVPNPHLPRWRAGSRKLDLDGDGPELAAFPLGLSVAPFTWAYLGQGIPMEFLGGFVGLSQDEATMALRPAIGWAVRETPGAPQAPSKPA